MKNKFKIGDYVDATPKTPDCLAQHEFVGSIVNIRGNLYSVRDLNDNCFDMEENELELMKD